MGFDGFSREGVQFLADLAANNDRAWFQPRKAEFERLLRQPLEELIVALGERFASRGIPLTADPARSPFRIYRDVRFSKDKSPYKTNVAASFPWTAGGGPGGYFSLGPGEVYTGGGLWHPEPAQLAAWRALVAGRPAEVHAAIDDPGFVRAFGKVEGDSLKRTPAGFPAITPTPSCSGSRTSSSAGGCRTMTRSPPTLPDMLADHLAAALPVFRLLAGLA